jgi:phasin family protein
MYEIPERLTALNKANLEAATRFAGIALEGTKRMLEVQLKTAKSTFDVGVQKQETLAESKDLSNLAQLMSTFAQPNLENATSYVASIYEIATSTQSEINQLVEEQIAEFNNRVVGALDRLPP